MHQRSLLTEFLKDQPRGKFYLMVFITDLGSEIRVSLREMFW